MVWPFHSESQAARAERAIKRLNRQRERLAQLARPVPWRDLGKWY